MTPGPVSRLYKFCKEAFADPDLVRRMQKVIARGWDVTEPSEQIQLSDLFISS